MVFAQIKSNKIYKYYFHICTVYCLQSEYPHLVCMGHRPQNGEKVVLVFKKKYQRFTMSFDFVSWICQKFWVIMHPYQKIHVSKLGSSNSTVERCFVPIYNGSVYLPEKFMWAK